MLVLSFLCCVCGFSLSPCLLLPRLRRLLLHGWWWNSGSIHCNLLSGSPVTAFIHWFFSLILCQKSMSGSIFLPYTNAIAISYHSSLLTYFQFTFVLQKLQCGNAGRLVSVAEFVKGSQNDSDVLRVSLHFIPFYMYEKVWSSKNFLCGWNISPLSEKYILVLHWGNFANGGSTLRTPSLLLQEIPTVPVSLMLLSGRWVWGSRRRTQMQIAEAGRDSSKI